MEEPLAIFTDLDRTLIPNGDQPESPEARILFRQLTELPTVKLVYVSGRRLELQQEAVREFDLPEPDFAVADVGASIYAVAGGEWRELETWSSTISQDWLGRSVRDIIEWLKVMPQLELQDASAQSDLKLSYTTPADIDPDALKREVAIHLTARKLPATIIWSLDETREVGLLDILPPTANKREAMLTLIDLFGIDRSRTLFAGDSGNDISALSSGQPSVLVANATDAVRAEAVAHAKSAGCADRLHCATGGFLGMNGNYAAGILEGIAFHFPDAKAWLESAASKTAA